MIRHSDREGLQAHLGAQGIGTAIHYPIPLHLQKAYRSLGYRLGDFPVTESVAPQILSLPMYAQLRPEQQQKVAEAIGGFVETRRPALVDERQKFRERDPRSLFKRSLLVRENSKAVKKTKVVVAGLGEVGKPLFDLLSTEHDVIGVDISPPERIEQADILHVCFPFQIKDFIGEAARYIDLFKPALTVVNSTVAIGTTRAIAERTGAAVVNSPVRGKHARMLEELSLYTKFVGAMDPAAGEQAARHFESVGLKTKVLSSPEATELAKLTETTYFGVLIAWAQEIERYCDQSASGLRRSRFVL